MLLLRKSFFFFFLIFLLHKRIKSSYVSLVNDEFHVVKSPVSCTREFFIYFHNELYKICNHITDGPDSKLYLYVQKKIGNSWEIQDELLKGDRKSHVNFFFGYVVDEQIIIIHCKTNGYGTTKSFNCHRSTSNTGADFITERTNISVRPFIEKGLQYYSSTPFKFSGKKYLLLCGIRYYTHHSREENNFISCIASDDIGRNWNTEFNFTYNGVENNTSYFLLAPIIDNSKLSFYFYHVSLSRSSGKYIECNHKGDNNFHCQDANFIKEDKSLRAIIKLNNYYLTSYVDENIENGCYLYFTNENIFLLKPKKVDDIVLGCFRASFVKLDDSKILFIYLSGNETYSVYTLRYNIYV